MASESEQRGLPRNNFKEIYFKLKNLVDDNDATTIAVVAALILITLTTLILIFIRKRSSGRNSVVLVGLCDAGKTLLFSQLVHRNHVDTHTSIKENVATYQPNGKKYLRLVDLPGHERLRYRFIDDFKSSAKGLLFVIDSMTFQAQLRDVAEFLYNLLSDKTISTSCRSILIACNKQDLSLAKSSKLIKTLLEKEINTVRVTRSSMLDTTNSAAFNNNTFLGKRNKDFEFQHLSSMKIDFVECSAGSKGDDKSKIAEIEDWLSKIA